MPERIVIGAWLLLIGCARTASGRSLSIVTGIMVLGYPAFGQGQSIEWTNTTGGEWAQPSNWNPNQVPHTNDSVFISGSNPLTVSLTADVAVSKLIIGTGLQGTSPVVLSISNYSLRATEVVVKNFGILDAISCTIDSTVRVEAGGLLKTRYLTLPENASLTLEKESSANVDFGKLHLHGPLTNAGVLNVTNSTISIFNQGGIRNMEKGLVRLCGQSSISSGDSGNGFFQNEGLVTSVSVSSQTNLPQQFPFDSYPTLAVSSNRQTIYMVFQGMTGNHFTTNSCLFFSTSTNAGLTWADPRKLPFDFSGVQLWNPTLGITGSGRLLLLCQPIRVEPGVEFLPSLSFASDDSGASWVTLGQISTNDLPSSPFGQYVAWTPFGNITENNGVLFAPYYARAANNWYAPHCLKSIDGGMTWTGYRIAFAGLISEPAIVPITKDLILCVTRSEIWSTNQIRFPKMFSYWSTNAGETWFAGGKWLDNSAPILNDPACLGVFSSSSGPRIAIAWGNRTDCELYVSQALVSETFHNFAALYENRISIGTIGKIGHSAEFAAGGYPQMVPLNDDGMYLVSWYYEGGYSDPSIASLRFALVDFNGEPGGTNIPTKLNAFPASVARVIVPRFDNRYGEVRNESIDGYLQFDNLNESGFAGVYEAIEQAEIQYCGGNSFAPLIPDAALRLAGSGRHKFVSGDLMLLNDEVSRLELIGGYLTLGPNFQGGTISNLALHGIDLTNNLPVTGRLSSTNGQITGNLEISTGGAFEAIGTGIGASWTIQRGATSHVNGLRILASSNARLNEGGNLFVDSGGIYLHGALTNEGTICLTNGSVQILGGDSQNRGVLANADSGRIRFHGNGGILDPQNSARLINRGTFEKTNPIATTRIDVKEFYNYGSLSVRSGILTLADVTFSETSEVRLSVSSQADYGRLVLERAVHLAGTVILTVMDELVASPGNSFDLVSFPGRTGEFERVYLPHAGSLAWHAQHYETFLRVHVDGVPRIHSKYHGDALTITGTHGTPGGEFVLLCTTSLEIPLSQWQPIATNLFDGDGQFTLANILVPGQTGGFFRVQSR